MFLRIALALLVCFAGLGSASAKTPVAPSNLRVTPLGVNSYLLEWKDNSKNETGWEIRISLGATSKPVRFQLVQTPNITSYVVITSSLPGKTLSFQMAAYNGPQGAEVFSKKTSVVTAKAFDENLFGAPTGFTAKALDDGRVRLAWKDNATCEYGYQVESRKGLDDWKSLGIANPGVKFSLDVINFEPATKYSFRARAFKNDPPNPTVFTKYSNIADATTMTFLAPSSLVATPSADGSISLKWKDRSSVEAGYEIESKSGTAGFSKLGEIGANASSTTPILNFPLATDVSLRIRAFRDSNLTRVFSAYSNVATTKTTLLAKPTEVAGTVLSKTSVRLTWKDNSSRESYFVIQHRKVGTTDYISAGQVAVDVKEYTVTNLIPGATYDFRIGVARFFVNPAYSQAVRLTTDGCSLEGDADPPIFWNTSFTHQIGVTNPARLQSMEVTGLPSGLGYQASTRTISGTTTEEGVKTVSVNATFTDASQQSASLVLRIIRPPAAPVINAAFPPANVGIGGNTPVSLTGKFSDPDTPDARRIATGPGNIDVILYSAATPATVANFLAYANGGRYDNTFFHRSINTPDKNLVMVQGGGYKVDLSVFTKVPAFAAIQNEPGISNLAGTIAMAKVANNPNSATSEFFVNLNDVNASNLDEQNSGFTVFGRVAGTGLDVMNAINALPRKDYTVSVGGVSTNLTDVPMNDVTAPASMDTTKLVKITSVAAVSALRYEVVSTDSNIATAAVAGTDVVVTGVANGSTTITVKAIDLDNQMTSQTIAVTVP